MIFAPPFTSKHVALFTPGCLWVDPRRLRQTQFKWIQEMLSVAFISIAYLILVEHTRFEPKHVPNNTFYKEHLTKHSA